MNLQVGTSGFSYKEWKGSFYPEDLPAKEMLAYYSLRLSAVEINNTFYRMPQKSMLENWKEQVPPDFRFSIKAPQRITHFKRLREVSTETSYLLETAGVLEDRLGVILFQLPPNMKKDLERLESFLEILPNPIRATFEFRHPSWLEDDVLKLLSTRNHALCIADTDEMPTSHIDRTADWGYLRLRRVQYSQEVLKEWVDRIHAQNWSDAFVFFKHEDEATGPKLAAEFLRLAKLSRG
jgi:uncharacterized protein YecE (DUF72 family)